MTSTPEPSRYFGHDHVTVIEPRGRLASLDLRELWAFRDLLGAFVARDVRVRYQETLLGVAWALLRPLLPMVILTVVFGRLARLPSEGVPYALFVLSGLIPWGFFAASVQAAAESIVGSQGLVSKIYFPRLILPLTPVGVACFDLLVGLMVLVVAKAIFQPVHWGYLLWLPAAVLSLLLAGLGPALLLSSLTAVFRDLRHVTPLLLQAWMFLTPIVFPVGLVPARWRALAFLNPMAGPVELFRAAVIGRAPDLGGVALSLLVGVLLLALAGAFFARTEDVLADVV